MRLHALAASDAQWLPALSTLLQETVNGGASIGFLAPLSDRDAMAYWENVFAELGPLLHLWVIEQDGQLLGTVQLALCGKPNGRHRGEVQKLMVQPAKRGRGVARALMAILEDTACARQCGLLVLDTQKGSAAEAVYSRLGWIRAGEIPDFAQQPHGGLAPTVLFWKRLALT